ncbi:MAG: hypothetical protein L6R28_09140 [Planctomycetes bacterium]|nr:hypothetical protein [Planctomycetota bacterium]
MSRTGRILSPCRTAAALALALLLAACPSGVTFKRAGPCGRALCECAVSVQSPDVAGDSCCFLRMQPANLNLDAPAASNAGTRLALQDAFPPCMPGSPAACALLGAGAEALAAATFDRARPEPLHEILTPPPRS